MPQTRALTVRGARTRQRIVTAAADLIHDHGLPVVTNDQVRAAAGVSGSQLGHYFADKNALVAAVVEHQGHVVLDQETAAWAAIESVEGLRAWRDRIVQSHDRAGACRGGCPIGSLAAALAEAGDDARQQVAGALQRWQETIEEALARLRRRGELRAEADVRQLATGVLASLQGGLLLAQVSRDVAPLAAALDVVIDHIECLGSPR